MHVQLRTACGLLTVWALLSQVCLFRCAAQTTLPRFPAVESDQALETIQTAPGFRMELVAAEPLVHDPVAMAFDENGGLYVVEMRGYSEQREQRLGAVRRLEDRDGDGRYETSQVLVDGLAWPTAIACWKGGVFVAAPPDIWYIKDTDGDSAADIRRRVLTGFSHENVQAMVNSFRWGLDNRIHGATSSGGAEIVSANPSGNEQREDDPNTALQLRLRDFAFDPRTMEFSATTEGGQHGMGFDDWGRKFSCSNSDHIKQVVYPERYVARNRFLIAPDSRLSIAAEGRQPEVYRISPVEPWREMRTRLRLEGKLMQFRLEGGGRAAGYFTAATGITIYRGDAWPFEHRGLAIVGDVGSNLIHRNVLRENGIAFSAHRVDEKSEMVASSDTWFRPVQFTGGPDGNLYVADMYREIIEHPWSFGDAIKPLLDLTSGRDRGRIYRITHADGMERAFEPLGEKSTADLVSLLEHEDAWHRETAARLIYERQDPTAADSIGRIARDSTNPLGRLHALYALHGLSRLSSDDLIVAMSDAHPGVRTHAALLSEQFVNDNETVRSKLSAMSTDPDLHVRFQVAFSLGEVNDKEIRIDSLTELLRQDAEDPWIPVAVLTSLENGADLVFSQLLADDQFRDHPGAAAVLRQLARLIARKNDSGELETMLTALGRLPQSAEQRLALSIVLGIREGARTTSSNFRRLMSDADTSVGAVRFRSMLQDALALAREPGQSEATRVDAVRLAGLLPLAQTRQPLTAMLDSATPEKLQTEVVSVLGRYADPELTSLIESVFPHLTPTVRIAAMEALFVRRDRYDSILDAVERGSFNPGDFTPVQIQRLCLLKDEDQAERAIQLLSPNRQSDRSKLIEQYRPSLSLSGDVARGRLHYRKTCAGCHRAEEFGHNVGPTSATFRNRGREWMLVNILDPNREVNPEFRNYILLTNDGRVIAGLISAENPNSFTITRADGRSETVLRSDVQEVSAAQKSLMPEGLEAGLDPQSMADLLAYLGSLE